MLLPITFHDMILALFVSEEPEMQLLCIGSKYIFLLSRSGLLRLHHPAMKRIYLMSTSLSRWCQ